MMSDKQLDRRAFLKQAAGAAGLALLPWETLSAAAQEGAKIPVGSKPNLVMILADDLGIGDLGCYGATRIKTPNIDTLASQGVSCTDAHASAAVCTPTRYGLMTGRYYYREERGRNWLGKWNMLIGEDRPTIASLMKSAGYATACIGKWHLGFCNELPDYNKELKPGPLEVGFDYYFGTPRTHNEPPWVFVENHTMVGRDPNDPITVSSPNEQKGDWGRQHRRQGRPRRPPCRPDRHHPDQKGRQLYRVQ